MHAENGRGRPTRVIAVVIAIIGIIAILIVGAYLGVHKLVDSDLLEAELTTAVEDATGGLYEVRIGEIDFSITRGSFEARNVEFRPREQRLEAMPEDELPRIRYHITVRRVEASGVGRVALVRDGNLHARTVRFIDPEVELVLGPQGQAAQEGPREEPETLHQAIRQELPQIRVDRLEVVNAGFLLDRIDQDPRFFDRIDSIFVTLHGVRVDSVSAAERGRFLFSDDVELHVPAQRRYSADSVYVYDVGEINGSSRAGTLSIASIRIEPDMNDEAYIAQLPYRQDRIRFSTEAVELRGVAYRQFLEERSIIATLMEIEQLDVDVLTDFRLPEPPVEVPTMPDEHFRALNTYIRIDTIRVSGGTAAYNEIAEDGVRPGRVSFENMFATVYNVTNDAERMSHATPAVIDARAHLFGAGDLRTHIRYPLLDESLTLSYSGTLGAMPITALNEILEPVEGVRIESGDLDSLSFGVQAVASSANGYVRPIYRDFEIQTVGVVDGTPGLRDRIESFIANLLVIRGTNVPENGEPTRTGNVEHTRDPEDPFFKFLWESLRSGIFDVLGV